MRSVCLSDFCSPSPSHVAVSLSLDRLPTDLESAAPNSALMISLPLHKKFKCENLRIGRILFPKQKEREMAKKSLAKLAAAFLGSVVGATANREGSGEEGSD